MNCFKSTYLCYTSYVYVSPVTISTTPFPTVNVAFALKETHFISFFSHQTNLMNFYFHILVVLQEWSVGIVDDWLENFWNNLSWTLVT